MCSLERENEEKGSMLALNSCSSRAQWLFLITINPTFHSHLINDTCEFSIILPLTSTIINFTNNIAHSFSAHVMIWYPVGTLFRNNNSNIRKFATLPNTIVRMRSCFAEPHPLLPLIHCNDWPSHQKRIKQKEI